MFNYKMEVYCAKTVDGDQWNVVFPDVFGCGGAGYNIQEAIEDAQINLSAHLEFLQEAGLPIPQPTKYEEEYYSGKISLRLGKTLHRDIAKTAKREGISINSLINIAISEYIGKEKYKYKLYEDFEKKYDTEHEQSILLEIGNQMDEYSNWTDVNGELMFC